MKLFDKIFMATAAALCCVSAIAGITDLPVKTVGSHRYYCYTIKPGDTMYTVMRELGTDRYTIVRYNPSAEDGLGATSMLFFPVDGEYASAADAPLDHDIIHEVKRGETIYGIAKQYGVSPDDLIALNPQLRDGLKAGSKIIVAKAQTPQPEAVVDMEAEAEEGTDGYDEIAIAEAEEYEDAETAAAPASAQEPAAEEPAAPAADVTAEAPAPQPAGSLYTIGKGETIYGIAKAHGLTQDELIAANPGIDPTHYREGQVIFIPVAGAADETADSGEQTFPDFVGEAESEEYNNEDDPTMAEGESQTMSKASIAVILPFMLHEKNVSRAAARYTEFYKGILLAADTLLAPEAPIVIRAYDSAGSMDSLRTILADPELLNVQAIITPPDDAQMRAVALFALENGITAVNPFVVKDNTYTVNPALIQLNIPGQTMVSKAIDAIYEKFDDCVPVILRRSGGPEDHADFVDGLKAKFLANTDVTPVIITYTDNLTAENLKRLERQEGNLLFIPFEGKAEEASKYLPALATYASTQPAGRVNVAGYPEWVTFKTENRANMEKTNAVIYSRFSSDDNDLAAMLANQQFVYWYGSPTESAFPRQGLYGLDLGMFLIKALRANGGDFTLPLEPFGGIQNSFSLERSGERGGLVNDVIYLLSYRPGGIVTKTTVE